MKINDTEIIITKGDITESYTEAIVNAANDTFSMGGGVAKAIKKKGGEEIEAQAIGKGPLGLGQAIVTSAGALASKYVIHTVTMKMNFVTNCEIVRKATYSALICAQENKISSISFCALGCGTGKLSYDGVSKVMAQEVFRYLRQVKEPTLKKIVFVLKGEEDYKVFNKNVVLYLDYISKKISEGPFLTVDGIVRYQDGIVLIKRSNPPFGWALPGGFVDYGESVEEAVVREIKEEISLDLVDFEQFKTYSRPDRDPRFHTVSVAFVGEGKGIMRADSDAAEACVFKLDSLPEKIAFDHREIIRDYARYKAGAGS